MIEAGFPRRRFRENIEKPGVHSPAFAARRGSREWNVTGTGARKALVVEDEPLIAMLIEDMLAELGFAVVGNSVRGLDARFERAVTLQKPFASHDLENAISRALVPGD